MDLSSPDCAVIMEEFRIRLSWLQCKLSISEGLVVSNICIEIILSEKELQVLSCSPSWPKLPQNTSSSLQLYFCTMSCCCIPAEVMLYFLGFSYIFVFDVAFKKCVRKRGGQGGGWRCGIQIVHQDCISCGTAMKLLWGRMIPCWAVLSFCLICWFLEHKLYLDLKKI